MQPPPPSRAPAPRRSRRQLGQPQAGVLSRCRRPPTAADVSSAHRHRPAGSSCGAGMRAASPQSEKRRQACRAVGEPPEPPSPPAAEQRARAAKAPLPQAAVSAAAAHAAAAALQGSGSAPKPPPARPTPPARVLSCRRRREPPARRRAPPSRTRIRCSHRGQPLAPAESRAPEEPTSSSACGMVAGVGEHHRAEHEAAAVIAGSPWRRRRAARPKNRPAARLPRAVIRKSSSR